MKRLFMTMMAISLPVAALAQQPEGRPATEGIVVAQATNQGEIRIRYRSKDR